MMLLPEAGMTTGGALGAVVEVAMIESLRIETSIDQLVVLVVQVYSARMGSYTLSLCLKISTIALDIIKNIITVQDFCTE